MQLIDTHCHIHSKDYKLDAEQVYEQALQGGVYKMICVGTGVEDSQLATVFAGSHENVFASVGVHPHETKLGIDGLDGLVNKDKVVAIGEIGLDYYYTHSSKATQIAIFEKQLQLARDHDLPVIFHIREAFEDFWPVIANFPGVRGVLHSFTDSMTNLEKALEKGFYIGVNGISTFTKDSDQQKMFASIPIESLLLETDAPYLTPQSKRGKVNEPVYVREVAESISTVQSTPVDELALQTTHNATNLFLI